MPWLMQSNAFSKSKNIPPKNLFVYLKLLIFHKLNQKQPFVSWFQTFAVFCMLYAFFWVIPRRLNFRCQRFRTLCLFHIHRQVGVESYPPMKMEQTECSETSAYKIQMPGNNPEESTQLFGWWIWPPSKLFRYC